MEGHVAAAREQPNVAQAGSVAQHLSLS